MIVRAIITNIIHDVKTALEQNNFISPGITLHEINKGLTI